MKVKATSKVVYVKTLNNKTPLTPTRSQRFDAGHYYDQIE